MIAIKARVKDFVTSCAICHKTDTRAPDIQAQLHSTMSDEPFSHLMMDCCGPYPISHGYRYILVVVDKATRWVELFPLAHLSATTTAQCLLQLVSRYGMYQSLWSDQGTNFTAEVTQLLMETMQIKQFFSVPYHPSANGLAERRVAEVTRHLRNLILTIKDDSAWSQVLPLVMRIMNAYQSHATGHAPAQLVYGGALDLDRRILPAKYISHSSSDTVTSTSAKSYVNALISNQNKLLRNAFAFQQRRIDKYLSSSPESPTQFDIGQLVLLRSPKHTNKLSTTYVGPVEVTARQGNDYTVKNILDSSSQQVHLDRLKLYIHDKFMSASDAAMLDKHEFQVAAIIDHMGSPRKKSQMTFRIRWAGYDADSDTFEPYAFVKDLELLTAYAKEHGLSL